MQFESERLKSQLLVAKWKHIVELYERDKDLLICTLVKLTETHLAPVTQCAMKVSLAAQVMSHTVAAGLYAVAATGK